MWLFLGQGGGMHYSTHYGQACINVCMCVWYIHIYIISTKFHFCQPFLYLLFTMIEMT